MNDVIFCFLITVNVFGKPIPWNTMFNNTCRWTFTPRPSPNFVWENYSSANRLALIQHATMDDYYGALVRSSWVFVWSRVLLAYTWKFSCLFFFLLEEVEQTLKTSERIGCCDGCCDVGNYSPALKFPGGPVVFDSWTPLECHVIRHAKEKICKNSATK